ncbi:MAG: hypothetical protein U0528_14350 [Anaerolineae bacterium]
MWQMHLEFLELEVEEVDDSVAAGERKPEDLRIQDTAAGYWGLGEAKTAGKDRGVSQDFITKTHASDASSSKTGFCYLHC